jgi:hypothetical protein
MQLLDIYCSLGVLSKVVREGQMELIMDKLIELFGSDDEETRDIAGLGKLLPTSVLFLI